MQVVITGGAGMLGTKLASELLKRGQLVGPGGGPDKIERLILIDVAAAPDLPNDPRVAFVAGQVHDDKLIGRLIAPGTSSVFHFAAVVSAGAEADFQ